MSLTLNLNGTILTVPAEMVNYSPFLTVLRDTPVGVERDFHGRPLVDFPTGAWATYIDFLAGLEFELDEETATFFDSMGHPNHLDYPLEVWAMKLHDNWVRDHFYSQSLWRDPLYDLVPLKIVPDRKLPVSIPEGWYVAGGAALWLAGYSNDLKDVDLFTSLPKDEANQSLQFLTTYHQDEEEPEAKYQIHVTTNSITYRDLDHYSEPPVQLILRLYRSPSETVHGFDLDCVGIVYLPPGYQVGNRVSEGELWATKRTIFSLKLETNWFDPSRASPTYVKRLLKYRNRGFHIYLPLLEERDLNTRAIQAYFDDIKRTYDEVIRDEISRTDHEGQADLYVLKQMINSDIERTLKKRADSSAEVNEVYFTLARALGKVVFDAQLPNYAQMFHYARQEIEAITDHPSLLVLASFYDFYPTIDIKFKSDYEVNRITYVKWLKLNDLELGQGFDEYDRLITERRRRQTNQYDIFVLKPELLSWLEQDPMSQVSSTIHPEPIPDLREWYSQSPFVKEGEIIMMEQLPPLNLDA